MLRCSVTEIDSYLYWKQAEDMPIEDLLKRLRKELPPSREMLAGIAMHKALELAEDGCYPTLDMDGYRFVFENNIELALPAFRELKAERVYQIHGVPVTLVGKVDAVHGQRVEDHKTTGRLDAERYFAGYQWRFYLDIFGADTFRWNVFEMREHTDNVWIVYGFHPLEQTRYPGLERDCLDVLSEFTRFALDNLPERFVTERAA